MKTKLALIKTLLVLFPKNVFLREQRFKLNKHYVKDSDLNKSK
jgi:hypothetical protein